MISSFTGKQIRAYRGCVGLFLMLACAACGSHSRVRGDPVLGLSAPPTVVVGTGTVAGLGEILTDGSGRTLYMFPPDAGSVVKCTGACAGTWPPLVISLGHRASAQGAVNQADLGSIPDPNSGQAIVTYGGYPLYRYAGDLSPGVANGQNLFSDGGPWYALHPDLQPVTVDPAGGSS